MVCGNAFCALVVLLLVQVIGGLGSVTYDQQFYFKLIVGSQILETNIQVNVLII